MELLQGSGMSLLTPIRVPMARKPAFQYKTLGSGKKSIQLLHSQ
jgi:hypothetical protein